MRCCSCNKALTDFEATRRGALSGCFLDLCNGCIQGLGIATLDRSDLQKQAEYTSIYEDPDYADYGAIIPDGQHNGWLQGDEE